MATVQNKRILLGTITMLFWFTQFIYIPFLTPYLLSLAIPATIVGIIIGAYGFTQMVLKLPFGITCDIVKNHKYFILLGTFLAGVSSLGMLLFPSSECLIIANGLSGVASSTWVSFTILYSTYYAKAQSAHAIGLVNAFNNIGIVCAYIVGGILYQTFGIKTLFMISFAAGMLAFLLALFIKRETHLRLVRNTPSITAKTIIEVMKNKRLWFFSILSACAFFILFATAFSFTTSTAKQLGANGVELGVLSVLFSLAGIFSAVFIGTRLAQQIGEKIMLISGFLLLVIYCGGIAYLHNLILLFLLQFLCGGIGGGILCAALMAGIVKCADTNKKSTTMGLYQTVYGVGMTIGPVIMGYLVDTTSINTAFSFMAIIALVCSIVISFSYNSVFMEQQS
ncbi:MAG: arabinose efflux permease family protein [Firmicutes bacterium]|nr:arabinose efflux permease family protein [Bacillota bacterium]